MSDARRYFGTDGIRGHVGEFPITPTFVLKLGWAVGKVFASKAKAGQRPRVLIGKDTRISGYMFESALEAGLSAAGVDILILGPLPTPGIAYLTSTFHAQAGIVISASHNPHEDNGIKFFSGDGKKLPDDVELAIEAYLDQDMDIVPSAALGKAYRIEDSRGRYIEFCKSTLSGLNLEGLSVVLDCANGATYEVAPKVFSELGANVTTIGASPDGLNINAKCGSTHPEQLRAAVLEQKADLGIAFDGDGDRVLMIGDDGRTIDGDELLFVIACARHREGKLRGGVVGTLMSNFGLERSLSDLGIPFVRAKVGDRYVMEQLAKHDWEVGGESSGHIICLDATTTGDGIISALQVLKALGKGQRLSQWVQRMGKTPQVMINVRFKERADYCNEATIQAALKTHEAKIGDLGRVLLRPSGTEPLIRVMVEHQDEAQARHHAEALAETVQSVVR